MLISHEELKRLLHYDPETGVFTWVTGRRGIVVGQRAGFLADRGYRKLVITILGKKTYFYEHRLAWFYMTGKWPERIDHKEDKQNNWSNLRLATAQQNLRNSRLRKRNVVGLKGVSRIRSCRHRFQSCIMLNKKTISLGHFESAYEAHLMYRRAARHYFGEFARVE